MMRAAAIVFATCCAAREIVCQRPRTAGLALAAPERKRNASMHVVATTPFSTHAPPRAAARTYLFLLGYPQTGTSSSQFWLATAPGVSVLNGDLGANTWEEGWHVDGLKERFDLAERWQGHTGDDACPSRRLEGLRPIPWARLAKTCRGRARKAFLDERQEVCIPRRASRRARASSSVEHIRRRRYHSHWNLSKPVLLENSPPEILHARDLDRVFSPTGDVRFLVLARSPRNPARSMSPRPYLNAQSLIAPFSFKV